jgi:pyruvate/2-oxoglutarate dehydrogenase complex dihydrolipoamide acyltransferase (E2) component
LKTKGAKVRKGEALLEVETDKVNAEIEAPEEASCMKSTLRKEIS